MKNWKKIAGLFFPILIAGGIFAAWVWAQELCVERTFRFLEPFDNTAFRDADNSSVDHWGQGYITLNRLGADFAVANPGYFPAWVNAITAGDFDNDGWSDFVGTSTKYSNALVVLRNLGAVGRVGTFAIMPEGLIDGTVCPTYPGLGVPTRGVKGAALDTDPEEHCALTSGDYDGDGDRDFLYVASYNDAVNNIKRIWLYENRLIDTGSLSFVQIDKTAAWSAAIKGIAWSSTVMESVYLDAPNDNALDIIIGNKNGEVLKIINKSLTRALGHTQKWDSPAVFVTTGWALRGVSTVSIADFDNDTDNDMILGSVSYADLRYYKNNAGVFSLYRTYTDPTNDTHNNRFDGAASVSIANDFDRDGDIDLMIGTDNWNLTVSGESIGGQVYYFRNSGGEFQCRLLFDNRPTVFDFDLGAYLDYDNDGDDDFLIADGNDSKNYYLFINNLADVYNLQGTAQSTNITASLDPNLYAVTRLRVLNLRQSVVGGSSDGLEVNLYVSNNDGRNWEFYQRFNGADIRDYAALPWHAFNHYGSRTKWRAVLTAPDDNIPDYPNASYETPRIDNIEFEIIFVERREYSRTSVAASLVDDSGQQLKLIIGGTFYFPGWQGHLFAYDVSDMVALNSSYSELRTVSRSNLTDPSGREIVASGVTIRWDAGRLLATRSSDSRLIYTALPNVAATGQTRADFTAANVDALDEYLNDVRGDNTGLINFIRGAGREWKLGDINHSNPVVVGPPSGISAQMGAGYENFKATWSDRQKVLFVGANDGMLHCFDVLTGMELWGFIPFNLLPKLKNMWAADQVNPDRYFYREVYVDGSPAVSDVYLNGEWKTVLVCGQGPGTGSVAGGGKNFYFALDVTNPANPLPLWELTDVATMGETWSVPAIGKVTKNGTDKWVAFMGSGYDNNTELNAVLGHVLYAVDLETGLIFWSFAAPEVDTSASPANNNVNIQNAMPGSTSMIDANIDGYADRVYIGDLDGRIWKVDLSASFVDAASWSAEQIYEDPDNYPIITKPALWKSPNMLNAEPRLYFGTGADDAAPNTVTYSFVALIDKEPAAEVEWFLGNPDTEGIRTSEKDVGDFGVGEKVWADPKIADQTVYCSTLTGSIESVDLCSNLAGQGKLYARFVASIAGSAVGGTALRSPTGPVESLNLAIKTRSAVTIGETSTAEGGVKKREVYIQEYNSTVQRLEQLTGGLLKIRSWREVYSIYKK